MNKWFTEKKASPTRPRQKFPSVVQRRQTKSVPKVIKKVGTFKGKPQQKSANGESSKVCHLRIIYCTHY